MVNVGKRLGDSKKKKEVKQITFFNDPNDSVIPDPIQQFDILTGVEKEKKLRPKDVFEDYNEKSNKKKKKKKGDDEKQKHRSQKMEPLQERGKKRGVDKKKPKDEMRKGKR